MIYLIATILQFKTISAAHDYSLITGAEKGRKCLIFYVQKSVPPVGRRYGVDVLAYHSFESRREGCLETGTEYGWLTEYVD